MTTSVLDRVPVDEIREQASQARPGRVALTLVAGVFFCLGWVSAKAFAVLWLAVAWSAMAIKVGWQSAHGPSRAVQMARLKAQNEELQARLGRFEGV